MVTFGLYSAKDSSFFTSFFFFVFVLKETADVKKKGLEWNHLCLLCVQHPEWTSYFVHLIKRIDYASLMILYFLFFCIMTKNIRRYKWGSLFFKDKTLQTRTKTQSCAWGFKRADAAEKLWFMMHIWWNLSGWHCTTIIKRWKLFTSYNGAALALVQRIITTKMDHSGQDTKKSQQMRRLGFSLTTPSA